jgi:hypothetical protein
VKENRKINIRKVLTGNDKALRRAFFGRCSHIECDAGMATKEKLAFLFISCVYHLFGQHFHVQFEFQMERGREKEGKCFISLDLFDLVDFTK